ncbi:helix-turn-helix domain-containing protein [Teredinibacter sp. KSP-S5-2]|uniref:helix-turn-helix domain-containing protein n=1 Tax=Teredinibacter sp. KSP-S5-2 TaxID=3034506 RepID=UPI0029350695|nr:helix-turn-helix domain-containing protein [Teredinibacter sp. KSP-S5-2]WNO09334.1 helix-turn-helix domain-containing protein [Teredinibacter sp. KSP-S5-2]
MHSSSGWYITIFMVVGAINLCTAVIYPWEETHQGKWIYILNGYNVMIWVEGICLYESVRRVLFHPVTALRSHLLYHLITPAILFFLFILAQFNFMEELTPQTLTNISLVFTQCVRFTYGLVCLKYLQKYRQLSLEHFSSTVIPGFSWLQFLVFGFVVTRLGWLVTPVAYTYLYISEQSPEIWLTLRTPINMLFDAIWLACLGGLVYFSLRHLSQFLQLQPPKQEITVKSITYTEEQVSRLINLMEQQKVFLEPNITIDAFASRASLPTKTASKIINEHFSKNFNDFVNGYRIQHASKLLSSPEGNELSVLEICEASGFNSKSVFNKYFKLVKGMTPREFRVSQ